MFIMFLYYYNKQNMSFFLFCQEKTAYPLMLEEQAEGLCDLFTHSSETVLKIDLQDLPVVQFQRRLALFRTLLAGE